MALDRGLEAQVGFPDTDRSVGTNYRNHSQLSFEREGHLVATIFYEHDAKPEALKGKTIAILGYGSQGHAQAQNLRDSGYKVIVGLEASRPSAQQARADGMVVVAPDEAAKRADWIHVLTPDETQAAVYEQHIKPYLHPGKILGFSHGFSIHFKTIVPPNDVDVVMIAPKSPGHLLRRVYAEGRGVPSLIAIQQDASKRAHEYALAYAHGIGSTRAGVLQTTFKEETESDLFGEQAVLCGGLTSLIKKGFETLVEAGYAPEIAYFECLHEMKLIVDLIYEGGLGRMRYSISNTAEYGDLTRGEKVVGDATRAAMKKTLADIQDGTFAREWIKENKDGGLQLRRVARERAAASDRDRWRAVARHDELAAGERREEAGGRGEGAG